MSLKNYNFFFIDLLLFIKVENRSNKIFKSLYDSKFNFKKDE